jgi:hypothetical protein
MAIDWWRVFTHFLWIAGMSTVLAVFSHADWQALARGEGLRAVAKRVVQSSGFAMGMLFVCLGAGLGVPRWWERSLWLLLAAGFVGQVVWPWLGRWRDRRSDRSDDIS